MKTKISLIVICVLLTISNITTFLYFQSEEPVNKNPGELINLNVYGTEFEGTPYLVFEKEGKIVSVVHDPKDYME